MASSTARTLQEFYKALAGRYGPQHWWPAQSQLEIVVGAILTQNTSWRNVERAIANLREAGLLDLEQLWRASRAQLAERIRPAGYFNVKAARLKALFDMIWQEHRGDLPAMFSQPTEVVREQLLSVRGVGRETADAILLYAGGHPTFVVDTYTFRVTWRHRLVDGQADYEDLKRVFEDALEPDATLYNEFHALLVRVGKEHCRPRARCQGCPLESFEHDTEPIT